MPLDMSGCWACERVKVTFWRAGLRLVLWVATGKLVGSGLVGSLWPVSPVSSNGVASFVLAFKGLAQSICEFLSV